MSKKRKIRKALPRLAIVFAFIFFQLLSLASVEDQAKAQIGAPHPCECVEYILNRYFNGVPLSGSWPTAASMATSAYWGNSSRGPRTSQSQPSVDAIVVFQPWIKGAGSAGHIGYVESFSRGNNGWNIKMRSSNIGGGSTDASCSNVTMGDSRFIEDSLIGTGNFSSVTFWQTGGNPNPNPNPNPSGLPSPTNLRLDHNSLKSITMTWNYRGPLPDGFALYRSSDGGNTWTFVRNFDQDQGTITQTDVYGLNCGTTYQYKVQAFRGSDKSNFSNVLTASTTECLPTPCASPIPNDSFCAVYYDNRNLRGNPVFSRDEATINQNWGNKGPGYGLNRSEFSARWTGRFNFEAGSSYLFTATVDDGIRVYVDGKLIISYWRNGTSGLLSTHYTPGPGYHEIKVEYYQDGGRSQIQVNWTKDLVPVLTSCDTIPNDQFCAEYYNNRNLQASPVFVQYEPEINHDWGRGRVGQGIGNEDYSVRWKGNFNFDAGTYIFTATFDDGMRVYVDGNLIINHWRGGTTTISKSFPLTAGYHQIKVEYYQEGGLAQAHLKWSKDPTVTPTPTPTVPAGLSGNIAPYAALNPGDAQAAVDGNLDTQWIGGHQNPLNLNWATPATIHRIVVWDRPQDSPDNQQINSLIINFSDGTTTGALNMISGGYRCVDVSFPEKAVSSIQLVPYDASGTNGFSEVEVWATTGVQTSGNTCSNVQTTTPY